MTPDKPDSQELPEDAEVDKWIASVAADGSTATVTASAIKLMLLRARVEGKAQGLEAGALAGVRVAKAEAVVAITPLTYAGPDPIGVSNLHHLAVKIISELPEPPLVEKAVGK